MSVVRKTNSRALLSEPKSRKMSLQAALREVVEICGTEVGIIERALVERLERIEAKLGIKHVDLIDWKKVKHK
jgi:hypothetical protein